MKKEIKIWAKDQKPGMSAEEIRNALSELEEGKHYRVRGKLGFSQQIQALVFIEEVDSEAVSEA